jgi:hypothetical protein
MLADEHGDLGVNGWQLLPGSSDDHELINRPSSRSITRCSKLRPRRTQTPYPPQTAAQPARQNHAGDRLLVHRLTRGGADPFTA